MAEDWGRWDRIPFLEILMCLCRGASEHHGPGGTDHECFCVLKWHLSHNEWILILTGRPQGSLPQDPLNLQGERVSGRDSGNSH